MKTAINDARNAAMKIGQVMYNQQQSGGSSSGSGDQSGQSGQQGGQDGQSGSGQNPDEQKKQ